MMRPPVELQEMGVAASGHPEPWQRNPGVEMVT